MLIELVFIGEYLIQERPLPFKRLEPKLIDLLQGCHPRNSTQPGLSHIQQSVVDLEFKGQKVDSVVTDNGLENKNEKSCSYGRHVS